MSKILKKRKKIVNDGILKKKLDFESSPGIAHKLRYVLLNNFYL